jgi:hypothetical protein
MTSVIQLQELLTFMYNQVSLITVGDYTVGITGGIVTATLASTATQPTVKKVTDPGELATDFTEVAAAQTATNLAKIEYHVKSNKIFYRFLTSTGDLINPGSTVLNSKNYLNKFANPVSGDITVGSLADTLPLILGHPNNTVSSMTVSPLVLYNISDKSIHDLAFSNKDTFAKISLSNVEITIPVLSTIASSLTIMAGLEDPSPAATTDIIDSMDILNLDTEAIALFKLARIDAELEGKNIFKPFDRKVVQKILKKLGKEVVDLNDWIDYLAYSQTINNVVLNNGRVVTTVGKSKIYKLICPISFYVY